MESSRVCTWVFLAAAALVSAILAAPLALKSVQEPTVEKTPTCKDGDVPAAVLFKAADMRSETDRRLKTIRAEKEVLHAQLCGDSNSGFLESLEDARQETARMIEANRRRCEEELISIIPTMTRSVINLNLLEAIRRAMRTVIDDRFNPPDEVTPSPIQDSGFRPPIRFRRAPVAEVNVIDYSHLCPTGVATSEALLALGEAIGRSAMEYDAMRQIVVDMKAGNCPSSIDLEAAVEGKASEQPAKLPVDCGDMKRVVQMYIDSFTKQLPEVGKTVGDSLLEMLPEEEWCTGLEIGTTCYYLTGSQLPFSLAQSNCEINGGRMAMIKDPADFNSVRSFLMSLSVGDVWIGATDYDGDMTFTWLDGTPMVEGDWASGEPNNAQQMCAQMWRYARLQWDDDYCDNHKNVLCFKEKPQD